VLTGEQILGHGQQQRHQNNTSGSTNMMCLACLNDVVNNAVNNVVKNATKEASAAEVKEWEKENDQLVTKKVEDSWRRMAKGEVDKVKLNITGMMSKHTGRELIKYELQNKTGAVYKTLCDAVGASLKNETSRWEEYFKVLQDKMSSLRVSLDAGLKSSRQRLDTQGKTISELKKLSGLATTGNPEQRTQALEKQLQEVRYVGTLRGVNERLVEQYHKDAEEKKQLAEEIEKLKQGYPHKSC
jgi:hypothetical protein